MAVTSSRSATKGLSLIPAGFWLRFFAYLIDLSILSLPIFLIGHIFTGALASLMARCLIPFGGAVNTSMIISIVSGMIVASLAVLLFQAVISFLYFPLFEGSQLQATPGKWIFKLIVTEDDGSALTTPRAFGRNIARWAALLPLPFGLIVAVVAGSVLHLNALGTLLMAGAILITVLTALIQYPMAAFTTKKQALHDLLAHTLVVRREEMRMGETVGKAVAVVIVYLIVRQLTGASHVDNQNVHSMNIRLQHSTAVPSTVTFSGKTGVAVSTNTKEKLLASQLLDASKSGTSVEALNEAAGFVGVLTYDLTLRRFKWNDANGQEVLSIMVAPNDKVTQSGGSVPGLRDVKPETLSRFQDFMGSPGTETGVVKEQRYHWDFPDGSRFYGTFRDGKISGSMATRIPGFNDPS